MKISLNSSTRPIFKGATSVSDYNDKSVTINTMNISSYTKAYSELMNGKYDLKIRMNNGDEFVKHNLTCDDIAIFERSFGDQL